MDGARLRIGVAHMSTAKGQAGAASEVFCIFVYRTCRMCVLKTRKLILQTVRVRGIAN